MTTDPWPELPVAAWQETRDTLHMWTQVVGKAQLALAPPANHWWHITQHLWSRGLRTTLLPWRGGALEARFDFCDHELILETTDGRSRRIELRPRSVADFYEEFIARLGELDVAVPMLARPVEVAEAIPFAEDETHSSYEPEWVERFWRSLVSSHSVFEGFRGEFIGKVSPSHFFWGAFDLAVTRFSGRLAPTHPGGIPNCADWVMVEAYSHELSSAGYWPGGHDEGLFYSYAYPEPEAFSSWDLGIADASFDPDLGEFVLPYAAVRQAPEPEELLLRFLRATYSAAATGGQWDRRALERDGTLPDS